MTNLSTPRTDASSLLSREEFLEGVRGALQAGKGYATGKLGPSEIEWLRCSLVGAQPGGERLLRALRPVLSFQGLKQTGFFPATPEFCMEFSRVYAAHLRKLDCIGVFPELLPRMRRVLDFYGISGPFVNYLDQEPDRDSPSQESNCFLPALRGRKLLLVCSFAKLLRARANQKTFEAVWAKTGKPWFFPGDVDALEFPYAYSASTRARYRDVHEILQELQNELDGRQFDVALIAAGGLGIPLASHIKELGKVGISLGGHLQALFGVLGKRWRFSSEYQGRYVNDAWIPMPPEYCPPETDVGDGGAYW